ASKNLFKYLRILDESNVDIILAELVPDQNLGKAINDRLRRAASRI
ncbi:MAG: Sua5 family C-terminal domain-containing protein, partial [Cytophagales bacterium]